MPNIHEKYSMVIAQIAKTRDELLKVRIMLSKLPPNADPTLTIPLKRKANQLMEQKLALEKERKALLRRIKKFYAKLRAARGKERKQAARHSRRLGKPTHRR